MYNIFFTYANLFSNFQGIKAYFFYKGKHTYRIV